MGRTFRIRPGIEKVDGSYEQYSKPRRKPETDQEQAR
jgi:hypothetical protein